VTMGGSIHAGWFVRLLLGGAIALACVALWPASSQAFVSCNNAGGTLTVGLNEEDDAVKISRGGDAINVVATDIFGDGPSILVACTGGAATVTTTDLIAVEAAASARFATVTFELGGGAFAPGATPEADGTSEIEVRANMFARGDFIDTTGTGLADVVHAGTLPGGATGINLNAASETAPDVDMELSGADGVGLNGGGGNDVFLGRGAPGFAGPVSRRVAIGVAGGPGRDRIEAGRGPLFAFAGGGRDVILGSQSPDLIEAGQGRDLVKAGRAPDLVITAEGGRDRVNCGAGRDFAIVDRKDRRRGCEKPKKGSDIFEEIFLSAKPFLNTLRRK
jgi:RTX calcium-binding nonapeptide repeat (4 copies)